MGKTGFDTLTNSTPFLKDAISGGIAGALGKVEIRPCRGHSPPPRAI